jgi:receptor protein-tyrosine kinase
MAANPWIGASHRNFLSTPKQRYRSSLRQNNGIIMASQPDHLIERAAALLAGKGSRPRGVPAEPPHEGAAAKQPASLPPTPLLPSLASTVIALAPTPGTGGTASPDRAALPPQAAEAAPGPLPEAWLPPTPGVSPQPSGTTPPTPPVPAPPLASRPVLPRPPPANVRADAGSLLPSIALVALEGAGMVVARAARTRISEEYRIVIGRVLRALREESSGTVLSNLVMVTSARPGEGKSFTALNLAGSIAQHSTEKVLLVDLDAKLRPISALLGVGDRLGFHDMVADQSLRPEDVILNTAIANLTFLPVGSRSGELTDSTSVRPITPVITRLARRFPNHLIMLDAPPCLSTSDPHTIAPYVGQVVMVIEAERTQRSEVEAALDLVRVCPTITMLLNKVRLTTSHTFGAYDYYGSYT